MSPTGSARKAPKAAAPSGTSTRKRQADLEFSRLVNGFDAKLRELDENLTAVLNRLAV